jgi:hypothetical protein
MEPEGSLPCSQEPSTGPYPEPDQSNPHHPILLIIIFIFKYSKWIKSSSKHRKALAHLKREGENKKLKEWSENGFEENV